MNEKKPRREVTNEEIWVALNGRPNDVASLKAASDNRNVLNAVLKRYAGTIGKEDLETCGWHAVWRALQYHVPEYGQKFTTSLHRFANWECRRELRRNKGRKLPEGKSLTQLHDVATTSQEDEINHQETIDHVRHCITLLKDPTHKKLLVAYYLEGRNLEKVGKLLSCSKEAARQRLAKAVAALREVCLATLESGGVVSS